VKKTIAKQIEQHTVSIPDVMGNTAERILLAEQNKEHQTVSIPDVMGNTAERHPVAALI
jgi:hypothetical protein